MPVALYAQDPSGWQDPSPHKVQFITVDVGVQLEVLDWGGSGPSIVLLAGLGNTAHVYDDFAQKLAGITTLMVLHGAALVPPAGPLPDMMSIDSATMFSLSWILRI